MGGKAVAESLRAHMDCLWASMAVPRVRFGGHAATGIG